MKVILCQSSGYTPELSLMPVLEAKFPELQFIVLREDMPENRFEEHLEAEIFVGWPTDEQLVKLKQLKWIHLTSAGANGIFQRPSLQEHVMVTNSSGVFGIPVAEHAIALMFAFCRQLPLHFSQQRNKQWKGSEHCIEIQDATVGIIGLGDIGHEIAKRVSGLGANVIAVKRSQSKPPTYINQLLTLNNIDELLEQSDFIINCLPFTKETDQFLSYNQFQRMKKGAIFINVGRGTTVDEGALIEGLTSGHLGGAGLDVTYKEPLSTSSPLWDLPNVILTSHSAGISIKREERRVKLLIQNIANYLEGKPLINVVDRTLGY